MLSTQSFVACVDNDTSVSSSLCAVLRSHGYNAEGFASAEAFLNSAENAWCVITDVRLTGMSGLQLQRRMLDRSLGLPVIFMTAIRDETIRARALEAGAIGFFGKPLVLEQLLDCLSNARKL